MLIANSQLSLGLISKKIAKVQLKVLTIEKHDVKIKFHREQWWIFIHQKASEKSFKKL